LVIYGIFIILARVFCFYSSQNLIVEDSSDERSDVDILVICPMNVYDDRVCQEIKEWILIAKGLDL
jgi:hypothetical protein